MANRYLIIGATSDISMAFLNSIEWKEDDCIVAHYYGSAEKLDEFVKKNPCMCKTIEGNFMSEEGIKSVCDFLTEMKYIPTHILHVSALPVQTLPFRMESWDNYQNQINVQCKAFFEILKVVLPYMGKAKEGKIVSLLSSCCINVPPKGMASYTASKYMLMGMLKALASEYAAKNIQINMISPSTVSTKFNALNQKAAELAARENPLGRNATVDDIVPIIKFLFSGENTFISGANIPVTAGEVY